MTLTLTKEIEQGLAKAAERQGMTPEQVALATLHEQFVDDDAQHEEEGSAYDLFEGLIGTIHGSTEPLSQDTGKRFTEYVVEKHREGRL